MTDAALLGGRRDHVDVAQPFQRALHGRQARRVDTVVVCQQDQHGWKVSLTRAAARLPSLAARTHYSGPPGLRQLAAGTALAACTEALYNQPFHTRLVGGSFRLRQSWRAYDNTGTERA